MKTGRRFYRLTALMLCAVILFSSACLTAFAADETPLGMITSIPQNVTSDDLSSDPNYTAYQTLLTEKSAVVSAVYAGIASMQERIDVSAYDLTLHEAQTLIYLFYDSFPELCYVESFIYYTSGSRITAIEPQYYENGAEMKRRFIETAKEQYLSLVNDSMDDFTKALILHDAIVLNSVYMNKKDGVSATNYAQMVEGWGICQTYCECYAYLLTQCGIECEIVGSDPMNHAWVKAKLNGAFYNIDITWDDPLPDIAGRVGHRFFLFSDEAFTASVPGERNHYGYQSIHPADSEYYDGFDTLHNISTQLCYIGDNCFAIDADGQLVQYNALTDSASVIKRLDFSWSAGENSYWMNRYSSLVAFNRKLYYNSPDAVYEYDPETGEGGVYAESSGERQLFGLRVINNQLWGTYADSPNDASAPEYLSDLPVEGDLCGDADGDETVTILDATCIQQNLAFIETPSYIESAADADRDGVVTIMDATAIQRWLADLPTAAGIGTARV